MKDKNNIELQPGDILKSVNGRTHLLTILNWNVWIATGATDLEKIGTITTTPELFN